MKEINEKFWFFCSITPRSKVLIWTERSFCCCIISMKRCFRVTLSITHLWIIKKIKIKSSVKLSFYKILRKNITRNGFHASTSVILVLQNFYTIHRNNLLLKFVHSKNKLLNERNFRLAFEIYNFEMFKKRVHRVISYVIIN
jgi:hypothetical protein